jgi:hypothetical protein
MRVLRHLVGIWFQNALRNPVKPCFDFRMAVDRSLKPYFCRCWGYSFGFAEAAPTTNLTALQTASPTVARHFAQL